MALGRSVPTYGLGVDTTDEEVAWFATSGRTEPPVTFGGPSSSRLEVNVQSLSPHDVLRLAGTRNSDMEFDRAVQTWLWARTHEAARARCPDDMACLPHREPEPEPVQVAPPAGESGGNSLSDLLQKVEKANSADS